MKKLNIFNQVVCVMLLLGLSFQAGALSDERFQQLKEMAQHENPEVREAFVNIAKDIGGEEGLFLLKQLAQDEHYEIRQEVLTVAVYLREYPEEREALINQLAQDEHYKVRWVVALYMDSYENRYEDGYGIEILKQLARDENSKVRETVLESAGNIGGEEGLEIIDLVVQYEENEAGFSFRKFFYKDLRSWVWGD